MPEVFIAGISMTPLGRHVDRSVKDLTRAAVQAALQDAGLADADVQAAWFSNTRQGVMEGQNSIRGQVALHAAGFGGIPVFNTENACASSSSGLAQACAWIEAGMADVALVIGVEKMHYEGRREDMLRAFLGGTDVHRLAETQAALQALGAGIGPQAAAQADARSFFMDVYAALARHHMERHGTTQRQIAAVAAKNHWHSTMNPLAQYRHPMSVEEVLADHPVVWPLTRSMCSPLSDGAAAAVLVSARALPRLAHARRAVRVTGIGVASAQQRPLEALEHHCARRAAAAAYEMAGAGPGDMDVAEVHDATAFAEILQTENLGLCPPGTGGAFAERGQTRLGGHIPVNVSGGLVSKGHPIAATGLVQLHELVMQLRHEAGARQVQGARLAVAENGGGWVGPEEACCVVTVLERHRSARTG